MLITLHKHYEKDKIIPSTKYLPKKVFTMHHIERESITLNPPQLVNMYEYLTYWMEEYIQKNNWKRRNDGCRIVVFDVKPAAFTDVKNGPTVDWSVTVHLEGWEDEWSAEWELRPPNTVTEYFKEKKINDSFNLLQSQLNNI